LLRAKGEIFLMGPEARHGEAETCLLRAVELGRRQGARAWELRAATDLATLWSSQGRTDGARTLLQSAFEQFTEGTETADLKAAERLFTTLT